VAVAAFNTALRAHEATGYPKASEQEIPLRLERIDSFISFVRDQ
jgi:hypothetical protein